MSSIECLALDAPQRVQPVHPLLPEIKLPTPSTTSGGFKSEGQVQQSVSSTHSLHPVTCQPFSLDDLQSNNIESLLRQYSDPEAAKKAREISIKELRRLLDENERKSKEIEREMEAKEKTREFERKVYATRKLGKDG